METVVFLVAAIGILAGAVGVIISRNPVHAALSLVLTLFGIAVLFIAQEAHFLAAVQVIVYAGAIVVLFLFVIMLLGVDKAADIGEDRITAQRPLAIVLATSALGVGLAAMFAATDVVTGAKSVTAPIDGARPNVDQLADVLFVDFILPFEITAVLLTIAVLGAVVLVRRSDGPDIIDHLDRNDPLAAEKAAREEVDG